LPHYCYSSYYDRGKFAAEYSPIIIDMKNTILTALALLTLATVTNAQNITVHGTVISATDS